MVTAIGSPDQKKIVDVTTRVDGKNALEVNMNADISIGAVELKDATTDTRAVVKSDGTNNALVTVMNTIPHDPLTVTDKVTVDDCTVSAMPQVHVDIVTPLGVSCEDETNTAALVGVKGSVAVDNANNVFQNRIYGLGVDSITVNPISAVLLNSDTVAGTEYGIPIAVESDASAYWYRLKADETTQALLIMPVGATTNAKQDGAVSDGAIVPNTKNTLIVINLNYVWNTDHWEPMTQP